MGDASWLGMTTSMVSGFARYKQASAQYQVNQAVTRENNKRAMSSLLSTYSALDDEQRQIAENSVAISIDAQKQSALMKGSVMAQAGASGTGGTTANNVLGDITDQTAQNSARASMNRERQLTQLDAKRKGAIAQAESRTMTMPNKKPSLWEYAMDAGIEGFRNVSAFRNFGDAWEKW